MKQKSVDILKNARITDRIYMYTKDGHKRKLKIEDVSYEENGYVCDREEVDEPDKIIFEVSRIPANFGKDGEFKKYHSSDLTPTITLNCNKNTIIFTFGDNYEIDKVELA